MNPYVPFQLNEIAALKSIKTWRNSRVRIFGKIGQSIQTTPDSEVELRYFHSVGEEIQSTIIINISLISDIFYSKFNEGSVTQILGDLQTFDKNVEGVHYLFLVSSHIIRNFSVVSPDLYHQASTLQSIACPKELFMNASNDITSQEEEETLFDDKSTYPSNKYIRKLSQSKEASEEKGEPSKKPQKETSKSNDSSVDMFEDSD